MCPPPIVYQPRSLVFDRPCGVPIPETVPASDQHLQSPYLVITPPLRPDSEAMSPSESDDGHIPLDPPASPGLCGPRPPTQIPLEYPDSPGLFGPRSPPQIPLEYPDSPGLFGPRSPRSPPHIPLDPYPASPGLFGPRSPSPYTPFIPNLQSPWGDAFPRSYPPVPQPPIISYKYFEEGENHFVRRWQKWDQFSKQWVPDRYRSWSPSPIDIRGVDDYFYLNVRSKSQGEKGSLVFSDFSSILDSFLRTVFVDVNYDKPLEYPIHRLFQKMKVLRSRLDDARTLLDAEQLPGDLASKAEVFGFDSSSGCEVVFEYVANLVIHLAKLLEVVEAECKQTVKQFEELLSNGQISFELLEYYYEEGTQYIYNSGISQNGLDIERPITLVVLKSVRFSDDRQELTFELEYFEWDGVRFEKRPLLVDYDVYQGTRDISSLFLQPVTDEALAKVTERGRLYLSYSRVCCAEYYDDTAVRSVFSSNLKPRMRRVMIDPTGFHRASQGYNPNLRVPLPDNSEEYIARLPYWIGGYDLEVNQWRVFNIWDLKPVEYDQEAWSKLIMDENTKDLIRALVDNTGGSLGGLKPAQFNKGQTVLLKGPPGTGRMTAVHAVCNLLKRPLLTISAHDFSFDTMTLVSEISRRMSFAITWNAVIVVTDADRFLDSKSSIQRDRVNAALRQFESDDCISFWISSTCDEELLRRFPTVVDLPVLDASARRRLWLGHFGLDDPATSMRNSDRTLIGSSFVNEKEMDHSSLLREIEKLSWYQLDGRMIDNIVRSARALAASNGEHLSTHHVKVVMKAQRLDNLPLWRKMTRILTFPAKVLHT